MEAELQCEAPTTEVVDLCPSAAQTGRCCRSHYDTQDPEGLVLYTQETCVVWVPLPLVTKLCDAGRSLPRHQALVEEFNADFGLNLSKDEPDIWDCLFGIFDASLGNWYRILPPGEDHWTLGWLSQVVSDGYKFALDMEGEDHVILSEWHQTIRARSADQILPLVVSHYWHEKEHPDPGCKHLHRLVEWLGSENPRLQKPFQQCFDSLFWDWLSLPQKPRRPQEQRAFGLALKNMQVLYASSQSFVVRLDYAPAVSEIHPYAQRGWCYFEFHASLMKPNPGLAVSVCPNVADNATICPRLPDRFQQELNACHFTNGLEDFSIVCTLYQKLFKYTVMLLEKLVLRALNDSEAAFFAELAPYLVNLETLVLDQCADTLSEHAARGIIHALEEREGDDDIGVTPLAEIFWVPLGTLEQSQAGKCLVRWCEQRQVTLLEKESRSQSSASLKAKVNEAKVLPSTWCGSQCLCQ